MRPVHILVAASLTGHALCLAVPAVSGPVAEVFEPARLVNVSNQLLAPYEKPEKRQGAATVLKSFIRFGAVAAEGAVKVVSHIMDDEEATESSFVISAKNALAAKYPNSNILVFHDTDSTPNLFGAVHVHHELDLNEWFGTTKGYEIYRFDHGTFDLAGDGGYRNWGFAGCRRRSGNHVDFFPFSQCSK